MHSALTLLGALLLAQSPAASWQVDASRSTVAFEVKHPFRTVHGESRAIEARAVLEPEGTALVMARIPVKTFRSGDANRDAHMLEVLDSGRHPYVVLKARTPLELPRSYPSVVRTTAKGVLDFHGRARPLEVPLTLEFASPEEVRVRADFAVSLDAYEVERPSLLFLEIEDPCRILVDLRMVAASP